MILCMNIKVAVSIIRLHLHVGTSTHRIEMWMLNFWFKLYLSYFEELCCNDRVDQTAMCSVPPSD